MSKQKEREGGGGVFLLLIIKKLNEKLFLAWDEAERERKKDILTSSKAKFTHREGQRGIEDIAADTEAFWVCKSPSPYPSSSSSSCALWNLMHMDAFVRLDALIPMMLGPWPDG